MNALIRVVRNCVCLIFGHRWTIDPLSAEHVCIRCGDVKEQHWTGHVDKAIADLQSRDRSPWEQRAYDVLRSMFGTDTAQK